MRLHRIASAPADSVISVFSKPGHRPDQPRLRSPGGVGRANTMLSPEPEGFLADPRVWRAAAALAKRGVALLPGLPTLNHLKAALPGGAR